ncbi:hypothetical protein [Glutamicibacter sp. X7]
MIMIRFPGTAETSVTWRTLAIDNSKAILVLIGIFVLAYLVPHLLLPGLMLGISGLPMVPLMLVLSFGALLFKAGNRVRKLWWFAAAGIAWFLTPIYGELLLLPWIDRLLADEVIVSTTSEGQFVWTQWVWTLPFLAFNVIVGLIRLWQLKREVAQMKVTTS